MMLVPFNSRADVDNQIRNLFQQQNAFLNNTLTIRIDNLKNMDDTWLPNSDGGSTTVSLQLMKCKNTKQQDKVSVKDENITLLGHHRGTEIIPTAFSVN